MERFGKLTPARADAAAACVLSSGRAWRSVMLLLFAMIPGIRENADGVGVMSESVGQVAAYAFDGNRTQARRAIRAALATGHLVQIGTASGRRPAAYAFACDLEPVGVTLPNTELYPKDGVQPVGVTLQPVGVTLRTRRGHTSHGEMAPPINIPINNYPECDANAESPRTSPPQRIPPGGRCPRCNSAGASFAASPALPGFVSVSCPSCGEYVKRA